MTLEEAKALKTGDVLYHVDVKNADGSPQRWTVNGKVNTWKRSPERVKVPIKHGLYSHGYLTEDNLSLLTIRESDIAPDITLITDFGKFKRKNGAWVDIYVEGSREWPKFDVNVTNPERIEQLNSLAEQSLAEL